MVPCCLQDGVALDALKACSEHIVQPGQADAWRLLDLQVLGNACGLHCSCPCVLGFGTKLFKTKIKSLCGLHKPALCKLY